MKINEGELKPVGDLVQEMMEPQPLPMGMTEFQAWSDRIISKALVTADVRSQKFALANMIKGVSHTESFKPDAYFIHQLRKVASNQVAQAVIDEIKQDFEKERIEKEKQEEKPIVEAKPEVKEVEKKSFFKKFF